MRLLATIVEWSELGKTVAAAAIAGIGVTVIFSFAVLGVARLGEYRRESRPVAAAVAGGLSLVALAAFAASIVVGLFVMTDK